MVTPQYESCIEACNACALACAQCAAACLREADPKSLARCIQLDMDCTAICRLSADAMARDSENVVPICRLCAELCDVCGEECVQHHMDHCQTCAVACKRCAQECRKMSEQAARPAPSSRIYAHH